MNRADAADPDTPRFRIRHRSGTPAGRGPGGILRIAFRGVDAAAGAPLPQPAARSHRGPRLWPRVAARLRQAAAAAVVDGRGDVSADRARRRLLRPGGAHGPDGFRGGLRDRAAAGRNARGAARDPHRGWAALFQLHGAQVQSRRGAAAAVGARRLCVSPRAPPRAPAALDLARRQHRLGGVGQIFRRRAGAAARALRPRRPAGAAGTCAGPGPIWR